MHSSRRAPATPFRRVVPEQEVDRTQSPSERCAGSGRLPAAPPKVLTVIPQLPLAPTTLPPSLASTASLQYPSITSKPLLQQAPPSATWSSDENNFARDCVPKASYLKADPPSLRPCGPTKQSPTIRCHLLWRIQTLSPTRTYHLRVAPAAGSFFEDGRDRLSRLVVLLQHYCDTPTAFSSQGRIWRTRQFFVSSQAAWSADSH